MSYQTRKDVAVTIGPHEVFDVAGTTLQSGEAGNISTSLIDPDGSASSITVTVTEIGSTGRYSISFTPDELGNWLLTVTNPSDLDGAVSKYAVSAVTGVAVASASDAYCGEAHVVAVAQYVDDFTGSTTPTENQVLNFMAQRAGELYGILYDVMGADAPGPSTYSTTLDTSTDGGKALEQVLQQQNAIGAAMDALQAAGAGEVPGRSERISELWAMWNDGNEKLRAIALMYTGTSSRTSTHISDGEITEATVSSKEEDGLTFNGKTVW